MAQIINWGIISCGANSHRFAADMAYAQKGRLAAVASRKLSTAKTFAQKYQIPQPLGSYDDLFTAEGIDAVYISTPHPFHMENTLSALKAGKPVLCEKPFAMNARQVRRMLNTAEKMNLFLMEGMWTRFFPAIPVLQKWLHDHRIGHICSLHAEFGGRFDEPPTHRIFTPELGGGALLDIGIYVVSFASLVFAAQPETIKSVVHYSNTNVDDQSTLLFQYPQGRIAVLSSSSRHNMDQSVRIQGTKGMIRIAPHFFRPAKIELLVEKKKPLSRKFPHPGFGFQYEANHVADCLREKKRQSDIMPLQESLEIMQTMDRIRKQWQLKYPNE